MKRLVPALALLLLAPAAVHADEAGQENARQAPDAKAKDKLICRKVEELGSRLRARRVCMTREQWADMRQQNRDSIENAQRRACVPGATC